MAVRGAASKQIITQKILETFEGAFLNDKEIRIPITEDGEIIQVKVGLVAAKTNVDPAGSVPVTGSVVSNSKLIDTSLTKEEVAEVKNLAARLNL